MNIGQAAAASGMSAKMIRHYESIGVIPRPGRNASGYRRYADTDVQRLRFVRHARDVGFGTADIRRLLALWQDPRRSAREVRELAREHLAAIEARIAELQSIAGALLHLVGHCHGEARPDCPILDSLGADPDVAAARRRPDTRVRRGS